MTDGDAIPLLHLLKANPTLLPPAPDPFTGAHIEHRCHDEVNMCLRCGKRAQTAFVAHTDLGPRWLDLCAPCNRWLRTTLYNQPPEEWTPWPI